tara:strand:- start:2512 stop:2883 length:372 start_codon:yes stop_codon:yes gene_type:complete
MKETIELKVKSKAWTFNEIASLSSSIDQIVTELYSEMNLIERFELVKETKINDTMVGYFYADMLKEICMTHLKAEVAGTIKDMLNTATVNFGGNKNEVSERSVGGKPHKERTTDEKKDSVLKE